MPSLVASLVPGIVFSAGLISLSSRPDFSWLGQTSLWPSQLWVIAVSGTIATLAGVADWIFHRQEGITIGPNERKAELLALSCGGVPVFALMSAASVSPTPAPFLLPILGFLVVTVVLITYDELMFHRRRCTTFETALHRVLVFGHAAAFAAWVHLAFVRGIHV
jgi:hypothetical protein